MHEEIINEIIKKQCEIVNQQKAINLVRSQIKGLREELKKMQKDLSDLVDEAKMNGLINDNGDMIILK